MTAVEIHELVCDRCAKTEQMLVGNAKPAGWATMSFNLVRTGDSVVVKAYGVSAKPEADICPDCVQPLVEWWFSSPVVQQRFKVDSKGQPIPQPEPASAGAAS